MTASFAHVALQWLVENPERKLGMVSLTQWQAACRLVELCDLAARLGVRLPGGRHSVLFTSRNVQLLRGMRVDCLILDGEVAAEWRNAGLYASVPEQLQIIEWSGCRNG